MSRTTLIVEKLKAFEPTETKDLQGESFYAPDGRLISRTERTHRTPGYSACVHLDEIQTVDPAYYVEESDGAATPTWTILTSNISTGATFGALRLSKSDGGTPAVLTPVTFKVEFKISKNADGTHEVLNNIALHAPQGTSGGVGTVVNASRYLQLAKGLGQRIARARGYHSFNEMPACTSADEAETFLRRVMPWIFDPNRRKSIPEAENVSINFQQLYHIIHCVCDAAADTGEDPDPTKYIVHISNLTNKTYDPFLLYIDGGGNYIFVEDGDVLDPTVVTEFKAVCKGLYKGCAAPIKVVNGTIDPAAPVAELAEYTITYTAPASGDKHLHVFFNEAEKYEAEVATIDPIDPNDLKLDPIIPEGDEAPAEDIPAEDPKDDPKE